MFEFITIMSILAVISGFASAIVMAAFKETIKED